LSFVLSNKIIVSFVLSKEKIDAHVMTLQFMLKGEYPSVTTQSSSVT
jgi:hypothetical protein